MFLQDEKIPGMYFAVGDSYSRYTGTDWSCSRHVDLKPQKTTVTVDGVVLMQNGKFLDPI